MNTKQQGLQNQNMDKPIIALSYINTSDFYFDELLTSFGDVVTVDEVSKAKRFHFAKDQTRYLLTRIFIRLLLSDVAPEITPKEWQFTQNRWGKPLVDNQTRDQLVFNISHAGDYIVCAICCFPQQDVTLELGVDIEKEQSSRDLTLLAPRFFTKQEAKYLEQWPQPQKITEFYRLWTLKESFIKAEGKGLSINLDKFRFILESEKIQFKASSSLGVEANLYHFYNFEFAANYQLSLAIKYDGAIEAVNFYEYQSLTRKRAVTKPIWLKTVN
ncbi:hypothetical protein C2869_04305 [Saccharobesus litoralis]|uniref:Uncharacterized protein n=1 Tax=Saccharobesus litoralis TaxID=2172099 RepID=A0A2S0VNA7_9ALTE|nr:4'-phosphopantetheinyl transferase superfamily protein [Saccharobesus litoralis]AWB65708.1 hypothetical protein C2869_04305 [Saccharobesus litoralis]